MSISFSSAFFFFVEALSLNIINYVNFSSTLGIRTNLFTFRVRVDGPAEVCISEPETCLGRHDSNSDLAHAPMSRNRSRLIVDRAMSFQLALS